MNGARSSAWAALLAAAILTSVSAPVAAQGGVAERLQGRAPAEVVAVVERLAVQAVAAGLPVEPLVQKAMEGGAKGVPVPRVVAALEALMARLEVAARAVRAGGVDAPDPATIEAGAFALGAGLLEADLQPMVQRSKPPHAPDQVLRVAGALAVLGVPRADVVELLVMALEAGRLPTEVLNLPALVQARVARGATPAEAAQGLGRGGLGPGGPPTRPPVGPPEQKPPAGPPPRPEPPLPPGPP